MIVNKDGGDHRRALGSTASRQWKPPADLRADSLEKSLELATDWLLERQFDQGYWVAELEGDTILESEYVLLLAFLGREKDPAAAAMARYIEDRQLEDGGWAIYPGGPTDVSASVKAYFALKLTGIDRRPSGDVAGAAGDSAGRRRSRVQQLHAVLPGAPGPDQLRRVPVCSSRAGPLARHG